MEEIIKAGWKAISKELDPIEMALFFRHYNLGSGDYTKERHKIWEGITLDEIIAGIKEMREEKQENEKDTTQKKGIL
jgi:Mg/Co/Ni transporter MgtE